MKNDPFYLKKVAVRLVEEPPLLSKEPLNSPEKAVNALAEEIRSYDREVVAVLNMHTDSKPINMTIASIGDVNNAIACPKELLKAAILSNASGIILLHNHPSGNLLPSQQDIRITDKLKMVCDLIDVKLLDHIIVGRENEYYSFYENSIIPTSHVWLAKKSEEIKLKEGPENARESTLERLELAKKQNHGRKNRGSAPKQCSVEI